GGFLVDRDFLDLRLHVKRGRALRSPHGDGRTLRRIAARVDQKARARGRDRHVVPDVAWSLVNVGDGDGEAGHSSLLRSRQFSVVSYQLSVFSYQLSAVSC